MQLLLTEQNKLTQDVEFNCRHFVHPCNKYDWQNGIRIVVVLLPSFFPFATLVWEVFYSTLT